MASFPTCPRSARPWGTDLRSRHWLASVKLCGSGAWTRPAAGFLLSTTMAPKLTLWRLHSKPCGSFGNGTSSRFSGNRGATTCLVNQSIVENRLEGFFEVIGRPCNLVFVTCDQEGKRSQAFRTLFMQELIRGSDRALVCGEFLAQRWGYRSHAEAVYEAHVVYRKALDEASVSIWTDGRSSRCTESITSGVHTWCRAMDEGLREAPSGYGRSGRKRLSRDQEIGRLEVHSLMKEDLRELFKYRELLYMLAYRDIKVRYKQSVMGFLWAILMPVLIVMAGVVVRYAYALASGKHLETAIS